MKLISFDIQADFAFFRKPETNNTINLSYNIIHKPAILGFLGAILGLSGYQEKGKWPEYYQKFKDLKVGVAPLQHEKGNFAKTNIKYTNTIGYANKGSNFLTEELILINPAYRVYLLLDESDALQAHLLSSIQKGEAVYVPYLGKNEFTAWWINAQEYNDVKPFDFNHDYKITTIFAKSDAVSGFIAKSMGRGAGLGVPTFLYFERLPIGFDEELYQYAYGDFAYSNATFTKEMNMSSVGSFYKIDDNTIIQLF